jgi:hypothetical protein
MKLNEVEVSEKMCIIYLDLKKEASWRFGTLHNEFFLIFHILVCIVSVIDTSLICIGLPRMEERRSADGSFVGDSEVK